MVGNTIIKYTDPTQTKTYDDTAGSTFTVTGIGLIAIAGVLAIRGAARA